MLPVYQQPTHLWQRAQGADVGLKQHARKRAAQHLRGG